MATRSHVDAVLSRTRAELARGPLTDAERVEFDCARAWEVLTFEQMKYPERFSEQLRLPLPDRGQGNDPGR